MDQETLDPYRLQRMRDNVKEKKPNEVPEKPEPQGDDSNGNATTSSQT